MVTWIVAVFMACCCAALEFEPLRQAMLADGALLPPTLEPRMSPFGGGVGMFSVNAAAEATNSKRYLEFRIPEMWTICALDALELKVKVAKQHYHNHTSKLYTWLHGYLPQTVPRESNLLEWTMGELLQLGNQTLVKQVLASKRALRKEFKQRGGMNVSWSEYKLIHYWVTSRSFGLAGGNGECLVPWVDFINHAEVDESKSFAAWNWLQVNGTGYFQFRGSSSVMDQRGGEFYIRYQQHLPIEVAMLDYGFVDVGSTEQSLTFHGGVAVLPSTSAYYLFTKFKRRKDYSVATAFQYCVDTLMAQQANLTATLLLAKQYRQVQDKILMDTKLYCERILEQLACIPTRKHVMLLLGFAK